ncbi:MAG TPA: energy transducer TonB [Bryobacteraceae bacterium]|jgi:TonB family protein|nr:energy transducer TonB [Bryobacteraceae bacterium]
MTSQTNLKTRITRLLDRSIARTASRAKLLRTVCGFAIVLCAIGVLSLQKSSAQATPADKSEKVYKVGDGVTSPRPLYQVEPQYTEEARAEKISGSVQLSMVIGTDGLAHDISVIKGLNAGLDRNAAEAVQKWHFAPGTLNGEPVAVQAVVEVNFKLL